MDEIRYKVVDRNVGRGLFLFSLLLFAVTSSPFPVPEESLIHLVQHLHLLPFWPMISPVWGWLVRATDVVGFAPVALLPNALSVLAGATTAWLFYGLVKGLRFGPRLERAFPWARLTAGALATLFLVTSLPFWTISNRAHPMSLGVLLLLVACWLYRRYKASLSIKDAMLLGLTLSVGGLEFGPTAVVAPVILAGVLLAAAAKRRNTPALWVALAVSLLAGPALLLLAAWQFAHAPIAEWREFKGFGQVVRYFLIESYHGLRGGLVKQGWLILILTTVVPWLACLMISRQSMNTSSRPGWGAVVLHLVLTGISVLILFNGPLSPWQLMSDAGRIVVIPHLCAAVVFGYIMTHWACLLTARLGRREERPSTRPGFVVASAWGVVFLVLALQHGADLRASTAADMRLTARAMLGAMEGRGTVVTDGVFEHALLIEAHDSGSPVRFINAQMAANPVYRRYIASMLDDAALQNAARVGILPLINEWLKPGSQAVSSLAFQSAPDFWLTAGRPVLPFLAVYLDGTIDLAKDHDALAARHAAFWDEIAPPLDRLSVADPRSALVSRVLATHVSSVANDLGVYFENARRLDLAKAAYARALSFAPENISALANLRGVMIAEGRTNEAAAIASVMDLRKAQIGREVPLQALAATFGHIRRPASLQAIEGIVLDGSATGQPDDRLRAAIEPMRKGDLATARAEAEKVLDADPAFERGWILLSMIMFLQQDDEGLARVNDVMVNMEKEWPQLVFLLGQRAYAKGDRKEARPLLERALALWPANPAVYEIILRLDLEEGIYKAAESRVRTLLAMDPGNVVGNFALGTILYREGKNDQAEEAFRKCLERTRYMPAMNNLAWILVERGAEEEALRLAGEAIVIDATSSDAWDTLGVVHMRMRHFEDAEKALRRAVELDPDNNAPRIHLIELTARRGDYGGAHDAARTLRQERTLTQPERERLDKALRGGS